MNPIEHLDPSEMNIPYHLIEEKEEKQLFFNISP